MLKKQRHLACAQCRQRKLRCDRDSPCANCIKNHLHCTPGSELQRPRKRRFPEKELLERVRRYEELLRQHNVPFDPLHHSSASQQSAVSDQKPAVASDGEGAREASFAESTRDFETKNAWHIMSRGFRKEDRESDSSDDDVRESMIRKGFERFYDTGDHLLFGMIPGAIDISVLHPDAVQIFKLWQLYVDNVNPLLKVTHMPSLQARILEAAGDTTKIKPSLEALMFSIYCMSILSLSDEGCLDMFNRTKQELLTQYQLGSQQALSNCDFLRSNDRDCLTALFLYLVSARPNTAPQSLSCMLGVAIRIARRIEIHKESSLSRLAPFEAEIRRRIWWSLVAFDSRVSGTAGANTETLDPTWDCRVPFNVNDPDLWQGMKQSPSPAETATEALFICVRSELSDFIRHNNVHLDITNPILKDITKPSHLVFSPEDDEIARLEERLEHRYFQHCDSDNAIHAMTVWSTRAFIAKLRTFQLQQKYFTSPEAATESQHDAVASEAIRSLTYDTYVMTSPLTKGFVWWNHNYFPFPSFMQLSQDIKKRPRGSLVQQAWNAMSDSFEAWSSQFSDGGPFFDIFSRLILSAWESCRVACGESGQILEVPRIVLTVRQTQSNLNPEQSRIDAKSNAGDLDFRSKATGSVINQDESIAMGTRAGSTMFESDAVVNALDETMFDFNVEQFNWNMLTGWPGWAYD